MGIPLRSTYPGPLAELRAASAAGGGAALTPTPVFIVLPKGISIVHLFPTSFVTAVVAQFALNPFLTILRTQDNLATATDYSENAQDADVATHVILSGQGTAADGDYLFVGSHLPFRGVVVDVDGVNTNASVLTVKYWNGSAWVSISAADGTIAPAGTTMGQDGQVTWAVPSAWVQASLRTINSPVPAATGIPRVDNLLYWTRWEFSAVLSATVTLDAMLPMNRSTAYAELYSGDMVEFQVHKGFGEGSCIEAKVDAGTAKLVVDAFALKGFA